MLIVCNARPELFERRPGWAGGKRHATTLSLSPLSDEETARLISSLSDRPVMAAETQQALLARAGGNPLYAEQYVRMLAERGDPEALPLPETVQGIIAARLDALPDEEKSLLQKAAVMGKVFWLGALIEEGGPDRHAAELRLHTLERKDFVQRARRSSIANEAEYSFLHVLVRDVAYGQIPRGRRGEQHRLAADWIAALSRPEDHAEMLAHHHLSALELRRASGQPIDAQLAERALSSLRYAGDRALSLNAYSGAAAFYQSALELETGGSPERARLLFKLGRSRYLAGDVDPQLLVAACDELLACGDHETAAEAEAGLWELYDWRGEMDRASEHIKRARELIEGHEPSRITAYVVSSVSRSLMLADENAEAIRLGREALATAEALGLDEVCANTLINIGFARCSSGDPAGIEDLERADAIAVKASAPAVICRAKANLSSQLWMQGHLERSFAINVDAEATASRFGQILQRRWIRAENAADQFVRGQWHEALAGLDDFLTEVEAGSPERSAPYCYSARAQIRLGRDQTAGAMADAERALELGRLSQNPQILCEVLAVSAHVVWECGDRDRAAALAGEYLAVLPGGRVTRQMVGDLHVMAWTLFAVGRGQELIEVLPTDDLPWVQAAAAFAAGDLHQAADICGAMGALTEEARDRLWLAEALVKQNRRHEADVHLQRALAFYRSVDATRYIRAGEALFAASA
jgi:tetratricopeptide (TPR) repeat protein